jgi:hypothetical protein
VGYAGYAANEFLTKNIFQDSSDWSADIFRDSSDWSGSDTDDDSTEIDCNIPHIIDDIADLENEVGSSLENITIYISTSFLAVSIDGFEDLTDLMTFTSKYTNSSESCKTSPNALIGAANQVALANGIQNFVTDPLHFDIVVLYGDDVPSVVGNKIKGLTDAAVPEVDLESLPHDVINLVLTDLSSGAPSISVANSDRNPPPQMEAFNSDEGATVSQWLYEVLCSNGGDANTETTFSACPPL